MSIKEKTSKFMDTAFAIAVEIGENEVTIKTHDGKMYGEIQTRQEINLRKVQEIAGDIQVTIGSCEYGLYISMHQKL